MILQIGKKGYLYIMVIATNGIECFAQIGFRTSNFTGDEKQSVNTDVYWISFRVHGFLFGILKFRKAAIKA